MLRILRKLPKASFIIFCFLGITLIAVFSYLIARTTMFLYSDYNLIEKFLSLCLLMAESFILVHAFGYFINMLHLLLSKKTIDRRTRREKLEGPPPPVAIVVASYKEPIDVVRQTLTCFYNLTYPNKHLFFLDDTRYDLEGQDPEKMQAYRKQIEELCEELEINLFRRRWHGAKAGLINDFLDFIDGKPPEGYEYTHNAVLKRENKEKYIIVFDADMNPLPGFVEPLVAMMEEKPELAFIQTPQYYTNFETNRVAHASGLQQAVFYEYICEGKSLSDAMFCCGTNVIFRIDALMDVGKLDHTSVTEDFATSLKFHQNGWSSAYRNFVCAFGMGPEDLGGFFKQQFRWALGTVGLFRKIAGEFFRNPCQMSLYKWWEYSLSGTHYFIGWALFIMFICPVLYLFFEVPSYFAWPGFYFLFFTPYIVFSMSTFFFSMLHRNYRLKDAIRGQMLLTISFPVYMKASLLAILGFKGSFQTTPKSGSQSLPLLDIWPQLLVALLSLGAAAYGMVRIFYLG
ncbi:MAG: glycosyltransferase family 2 protein, partial [Candidatus Rifleibacteriota bacterium]